MKLEIEINIPEKRLKEIIEKDLIILVDSREKSNQHIIDYFLTRNIKFSIQKLEQGDYSYALPPNEFWDKEIQFTNHMVIEKKNSLEELSGNFSNDRLRIENEFAALYDKKIKTYLLIENSSYNDILKGNYNTQYNNNAFAGSFISFVDRYNLVPFFIPKDITGHTIYNLCKYHLRNLIK